MYFIISSIDLYKTNMKGNKGLPTFRVLLGYNPVWNEVVGFKVHVPGLAFLSFIVYDADQVLGQYTLPFQSVMQGE